MISFRQYASAALYRSFAEFRADAARNYLGFIWWLLEPALYLTAFYLVFATGLRGSEKVTMTFLMSGIVLWKWFSSCVQGGARSIVSNAALINQVHVPKLLFVSVPLISNTLRTGVLMALFIIYLLTQGEAMGVSIPDLMLVLLAQAMLIAAVATICAAIVPFIPDLKTVIENGLIFVMFMSGIFYDVRTFDTDVRTLFEMNPMVHTIIGFREALLSGGIGDPAALWWIIVFSLGVFSLAVWVLNRLDRKYPKYV